MSFLMQLLTQVAPLEPFETAELERYLVALQEDVAIFGCTQEDEALMLALKRRIKKERK